MASYNDSGIRTFTAGEALAVHRRVKLSAGEVVYADADEACIGFTERAVASSAGTVVYADADEACIGFTERAVANGAEVAVRLNNHPGTFLATAGEAVAVGGSLYALADGKVGDTDPGSGTIRYTCLSAGSGDGAIIEVFPVTAV